MGIESGSGFDGATLSILPLSSANTLLPWEDQALLRCASQKTKFLIAFLPRFGGPFGQVEDPFVPFSPHPLNQDWNEEIIWKPLVNMGPNRIGFVEEELVFYCGDSQDRYGAMSSVSYYWEADDGWAATGTNVNHAFLTQGLHWVTCKAVNEDTGYDRTGKRYVWVYPDHNTTYDGVVELQNFSWSGGMWQLGLRVTGDTSAILPYTRIVLWVDEWWNTDQYGAGGTNKAIDIDAGSVIDGGVLGRYDAHVVFDGIVLGNTIDEDPETHSATFTCSSPAIVLQRSNIGSTEFFTSNTDSNGIPQNVRWREGTQSEGGGIIQLGPTRSYWTGENTYLPAGAASKNLTAKDVAYVLLAHEPQAMGYTGYAEFYDLSLWTAEVPVQNNLGNITVEGNRWNGLSTILESEFAVLYCSKKGMTVARRDPNMAYYTEDTPKESLAAEQPILLLNDDLTTLFQLGQQPRDRTSWVKLTGIASKAKQMTWVVRLDQTGHYQDGTNLAPSDSASGSWARNDAVRTDADPRPTLWDGSDNPDYDPNSPLIPWTHLYYRKNNSVYPNLSLTVATFLHVLEPYDIVAVTHTGRQQ